MQDSVLAEAENAGLSILWKQHLADSIPLPFNKAVLFLSAIEQLTSSA